MNKCLNKLMRYNQPLMIGLLVLFSALTLQGQNNKISQVDSILSHWYGPNAPSVSVLIMHEDEVKVKNSYGLANIDKDKEARAYTNYDLGTLTEQFTAMAVMILIESDQLKIKESISAIFHGLPDYCQAIQVKHLINHTSGLPYLKRMKFYREVAGFDDVKKFLNNNEQLNEPGQKTRLNPVNYALLASVIEKVTGNSYRKFVKKRIFSPLGMEDSRVYKKGWFSGVPNKSISYLRRNDTIYENAGVFPDKYFEGAIGVFSNLNDIKKWLLAWKTDTLVSKKMLNKAKQINFFRGQKIFPGYGWIKAFNNKGSKYLYRGGIGRGSTNILLRLPEEDISVAILSNQASLFGMHRRAFELVNLYSERQYSTD